MRMFIFLAGATVLAGCATTNSVVIEGAQKPQQDLAEPSLALTANLLDESFGVAGSPVLIELAVSSPDGRDAAQQVTISSPGGSWDSLVQIEVRDSTGHLVEGLDIRPLLEPEESTTVTLDASALAVWAVVLPGAGTYSIEAVLDSTNSAGGGWRGKCSSGPVTLSIRPSLGELSAQEATISTLAVARIHEYALELDEALAVVASALGRTPNDSLLLEEKADILAKSGNYQEAMAAYDAALALVTPDEDVLLREPPESLLQKRAMAEAKSKELSALKR